MTLTIRTTGLNEYAPSGDGNLKVMLIGGPGVGKTRHSSYWPKPIYLDCEAGLSSVADRKVAYVAIKTSKDMLDALVELKKLGNMPINERPFRTVVIDTLDAFQRKVKDEWLQLNPSEKSFKGYDAWGYLESKMSMLLTRLLNLDMNVIVCVHYKEKTVSEGEGASATERTIFQLQLAGAVKDEVFNDFDLVGWMGTYFATVEGQRVEKRGVTFTPTEAKPFLKDRLHATPKWLEINFSEEDYTNLFMAVVQRLDDLPASTVVGEIPDSAEGDREPSGLDRTAGVVAPGVAGALPPQDERDVPLHQFDKPTLFEIAKREGVTTTVAGVPIRNNTLKPELVAAIEARRANPQQTPVEAPAAPVETVNKETGEVAPDPSLEWKTDVATESDAIENVLGQLGGEVEKVTEAPKPEPTPTPVVAEAPVQDENHCQVCGTDINADDMHTSLAWIKYRMRLCSADFQAERANRS